MNTQNAKIGRSYPKTASTSNEKQASSSISSNLNKEIQFSKSFHNKS